MRRIRRSRRRRRPSRPDTGGCADRFLPAGAADAAGSLLGVEAGGPGTRAARSRPGTRRLLQPPAVLPGRSACGVTSQRRVPQGPRPWPATADVEMAGLHGLEVQHRRGRSAPAGSAGLAGRACGLTCSARFLLGTMTARERRSAPGLWMWPPARLPVAGEGREEHPRPEDRDQGGSSFADEGAGIHTGSATGDDHVLMMRSLAPRLSTYRWHEDGHDVGGGVTPHQTGQQACRWRRTGQ